MTDVVVAEGIRQLHARYADAVWRRDWKSFGDCWTEDGEWRIGGAIIQGRGQLVENIGKFMAKYNRVLMTFRTPMFEVIDGVAHVRTYVDERNSTVDGDFVNSIGIYYERLVQQDGLWRRRWALFQLQYLGPADLVGKFYDQPDFGPPPAMPPMDQPTLAHRPQPVE